MNLDVNKISQNPKDQWEAIDLLVKSQSRVLEAINIMNSVLRFPDPEDREVQLKMMQNFIKQFEND